MLRLLLSVLLICLLYSCTSLSKAMKFGELETSQPLTTVPIIKNKRLNFVEAKIEGETYIFFIDTGAPNIVSEELAQKLRLKTVTKFKTGDSQGNEEKTNYVKLPEIWVGDFHFTNTVAMVSDLSGTPGIQCLGIDGIIGSNLMQRAIWQFDFQGEQVHIARTKADLPISIDSLAGIPFKRNTFKTPKFDMEYGPVISRNVKLDLGSGNGIDANKKAFGLLLERDSTLKYLTRLGSSSYGVFGSEKKLDSTYHTNDIPIVIGGQTYEGQNIRFQNNERSTKVGMKFWEHFLLTIDWFENKIYLQPQSILADTAYVSAGFNTTHRDDKLFIAAKEKGGPADKAGLELGDQIMRLNGIDYRHVSLELWCKGMQYGLEGFDADTLQLEVQSPDGQIKNRKLVKKDLLE